MKYSLILGLLVLGACADKVADQPAPNPTTTPQDDRGDTDSNSTLRYCLGDEAKIYNVTKSSLEGYFGRITKNIEGDVTHCLEVNGIGENVSAKLRVEYEDDYGITSFEASESLVQYGWGSVKKVSNKYVIDIIWMDGQGLIQVKATETAVDSGNMEGSIRYYNFPSYESQLQASINEVKAKCKSGEWTVARCLGYVSPYPSIKWWENEEDEWDPEVKARELLTSSGSKLGNIAFELSNVVNQ